MKRRIEKAVVLEQERWLENRGALRERRPAVHFAGYRSAEFARGHAGRGAQQNCARGIGSGEKIEAGHIFYAFTCGQNRDWKF